MKKASQLMKTQNVVNGVYSPPDSNGKAGTSKKKPVAPMSEALF